MSRDEIINDLMRRRPEGPEGTNISYTTRDGDYNYRTCEYKQIVVPSDASYGYDDETLFKLEFRSNDEVKDYIRKRDFESISDWNLGRKKATLSRRANKVWERIQSAVHRTSRRGGEGIYNITPHYRRGRVLGNLYARNFEEAKETARLFFGYLCPDEELRVAFLRFGSVDDVVSINEKTMSSIQTQIDRCQKEIKDQRERIQKLEATMTTLQTVESQQIAIESIHALDAQAAAA